MRPPSPAHGLVVFHCLVAASAALAQALPGPSMPSGAARVLPPAPPMAAPSPSTASTGLDHRSAFEGYVPFSDGPPTAWREANDTVRRRGGWKAYAEEAARPQEATGPHAHGHGHGHYHPTPVPGPAPAKERP